MRKYIVYANDSGQVCIITPAPEAVMALGIEVIAKICVPAGKPYKIAGFGDFPIDGTFNENGDPNMDKTFRAAWVVDESALNDGFGADYGAGSEWDVVGYLSNGGVIVRHKMTGKIVER